MTLTKSLTLLLALGAGISTASAAVISSATFDVDPTSVAADSNQNGQVDNPLSFTSITVGDVTYTNFTYGTASSAGTSNSVADQSTYTLGDAVNTYQALTGSVVTDGVAALNSSLVINFGRVITANDLIFFTDLEIDGDVVRDEDIVFSLIDSTGTIIPGTTTTFFNIGSGGPNLLNYEGNFSGSAGTLRTLDLYGAAYTLADFGYTGDAAVGLRVGATRDVDLTVVGLATIPEPSTAALFGMMCGSAVLARRRNRKG